MRKYFLGFIALLICPPLPGQDQRPVAGIAVTQVDVSGLAAGILDQTHQARAAVAARDKAAAQQHIAGAMDAAKQISQTTHDPSRPFLVPVYTEVDSVSTYGPVKHGKGDTLTANRMKKSTSVRETNADITRAALNIGIASDRLEAARAAVDRDDFAAADAALAGVEGAVVREAVNEDTPLLRARQNLELARSRILEGKYKDAAAPLRAAAQALDNYQRISPGPHATTAASMAHDMRSYADIVGRDHSDAVTKLEMWIDPVNQWFNEMVK